MKLDHEDTFRQIFKLYILQFQYSFSEKNIIAGYIMEIAFTIINTLRYIRFADYHSTNIFEAYINNYSALGSFTLMSFSMFIVLSDAPFIDEETFLLLHRTSRKRWYFAMWFYMFSHIILFNMISLCTSVLLMIRQSYVNNKWSKALIYALMYNQTALAQKYNITLPDVALINTVSPGEAMMRTLLCVLLYCLLIGAVMFTLNLYFPSHAVGTMAAGIIHLAGFLMSSLEFTCYAFEWLSPLKNAMYESHWDSTGFLPYLPVKFTAIYFLLPVIILGFTGAKIVRNTDIIVRTEIES